MSTNPHWVDAYYPGQRVQVRVSSYNGDWHWGWYDATVLDTTRDDAGRVYCEVPAQGLGWKPCGDQYIRPVDPPFTLNTRNLEEVEAWLNSATA